MRSDPARPAWSSSAEKCPVALCLGVVVQFAQPAAARFGQQERACGLGGGTARSSATTVAAREATLAASRGRPSSRGTHGGHRSGARPGPARARAGGLAQERGALLHRPISRPWPAPRGPRFQACSMRMPLIFNSAEAASRSRSASIAALPGQADRRTAPCSQRAYRWKKCCTWYTSRGQNPARLRCRARRARITANEPDDGLVGAQVGGQ